MRPQQTNIPVMFQGPAPAPDNVTLKYALDLANKGFDRALQEDKALQLGLNTYHGKVTYSAVADALVWTREELLIVDPFLNEGSLGKNEYDK